MLRRPQSSRTQQLQLIKIYHYYLIYPFSVKCLLCLCYYRKCVTSAPKSACSVKMGLRAVRCVVISGKARIACPSARPATIWMRAIIKRACLATVNAVRASGRQNTTVITAEITALMWILALVRIRSASTCRKISKFQHIVHQRLLFITIFYLGTLYFVLWSAKD